MTLNGLGPLRIGLGKAKLRARHEPLALIVETWDGRARSMRVGTWLSVQLIEGCS